MHWENSGAHNLCDVCGFDGEDWDALEDHYITVGCHPYCCHGCDTWFRAKATYDAHLELFVACRKCDKHCLNRNNLDQHMITHKTAKLECWGCYNTYIRMSHLMLHLESGGCPSGCGLRDINYRLLARCDNIHHFVAPKYIADFCHGVDIENVHGRMFPFECMECGNRFRFLSGLCQHMESSISCDQRTSDVSFKALQKNFVEEFLSASTATLSASGVSTRRGSASVQPADDPKPANKRHLCPESNSNRASPIASVSHAASKMSGTRVNNGLDIPVKCWGCNEQFKDVFRMIVHLEFGKCTSHSNQRWFDSLVSHIQSWKKVIVDESHKNMLTKTKHVTDDAGPHVKPFHCDRCQKRFPNLSGLVFHVLHEDSLVGDGSGGNVRNNGLCSKTVDDLVLKEIKEVFTSVFCGDGL